MPDPTIETGRDATGAIGQTGAQATPDAAAAQTAAPAPAVEIDLSSLGDAFKEKKIDQEALTALLGLPEKDKDWKDNLKLLAGDPQLFGMYSKDAKAYTTQQQKRLTEAGETARKAREFQSQLSKERDEFNKRVKGFEAMAGEAAYQYDPKVKEARDKFSKMVENQSMTQEAADMALQPYVDAAKERAQLEDERRSMAEQELSGKIKGVAQNKLSHVPGSYAEAIITDGVLGGVDAEDAAVAFNLWLESYTAGKVRAAVMDAVKGLNGQPRPTETKSDTAKPVIPENDPRADAIAMGRLHYAGMTGGAKA